MTTVITHWSRKIALPERTPWYYIAVAAVAFAIVVIGDRSIYLLGTAIGLGAIAAILLDRRLAIPIIIVTLPLEISKEIFSIIPVAEEWANAGGRLSIVDVGRITILFAGFVWVITARTDSIQYLPRTSLLLPLLLLFGLYVLSMTYTVDAEAGLREIIRYLFNFGFFLMIPLFVRDRNTLHLCLWTLVATGLALGLLGIYQKFLGTYFFLWNPKLLLEVTTRVNATFANPNFFARFLNISILMCIALLFAAKNRNIRLLLLAIIGIDALTLLLTNSRNGWVTLAAVLPAMLLLFPVKTGYKLVMLAAGLTSLLGIVLMAGFFSDVLADRFETFQLGLRAIGERYYLIQGGWAMFLDHPWTGVGIGGFINALGGPYVHYVWWRDGYYALPSHTAFLTLLAELGALSLVIVSWLIVRVGLLCTSLYRNGRFDDKLVVLGLVGTLLTITLSSQVEGRLFEDPYLWLAFGLLVSLEAIQRREQEAQAEADAAQAARRRGRRRRRIDTNLQPELPGLA